MGKQLDDNQSKYASDPQIWAVASGKGGVGKSFIAANLGMALAHHEKKVILIDLDLGSANMHTCLGITSPSATLSHLFSRSNIDIRDLVIQSKNPFVSLISGASDDLQIANLKHFQKLKIMRHLSHLEADYIILDLGAGTSFNTLDFFLFAHQSLLTVVPEPTSIENSYRFIKCLLARKLKSLPKQTNAVMQSILQQRKKDTGKSQCFASFLTDVQTQQPQHGKMIVESLSALSLNLMVNQVLEPADIKLGSSMGTVFQKYFGLDLNVLGYLYHDIHVIQSLKLKQAYYPQFPQSRNAMCLNRITAKIIEKTECQHNSISSIV